MFAFGYPLNVVYSHIAVPSFLSNAVSQSEKIQSANLLVS